MRIVMMGLLLENDEDLNQVTTDFEEEGFTIPKLVGKYKTLAGQGEEGGRQDVVFDVSDKDIPRLATHFYHSCGLFVWADDYVRNNITIIPKSAYGLFETYLL